MSDVVVNPATLNELIGNRIREMREGREISQTDFGLQMRDLVGAGWSRQVVWQVENGQKTCSAADLIAAAQVLSCTVVDLVSSDRAVSLGGSRAVRTDALVSGPNATPEIEGWSRYVEAGEALNDVRNAWERYSHAIGVVRSRASDSESLRARIARALDGARETLRREIVETFADRTPPGFDADDYARASATPAMQVAADALSDYPIPYALWRVRETTKGRRAR
jgi:transcriptional regulator with XRE-family HTH domain